jgi:hypothetical protein
MEFRIDILDDRLDGLATDDDRERVRLYFERWRAGAFDPLRDPGVVVIVTLDDEPVPRRVVVNDGEDEIPDLAFARPAC